MFGVIGDGDGDFSVALERYRFEQKQDAILVYGFERSLDTLSLR